MAEVDLPDIFPRGTVDVSDEQHLYRVFEGTTSDESKDEYTLDKAPIKEIQSVIGTKNGGEYEFVNGTDYELSSDSERLVWLNGDRPDDNTNFRVNYTARSIIDRYIESGESELDDAEKDLENALSSKFVDEATGDELDEIGKLFGDTVGSRRGRTDPQYRFYLKSVARSFISRGTKSGIKAAISAATEVPVEDITISEDFQNNAYEVVVIPNTPVKSEILNEVAQIADPSGIKLRSTRFEISPDTIGVDDSVGSVLPIQTNESFVANDAVTEVSSSPTNNWNGYDWDTEDWAG